MLLFNRDENSENLVSRTFLYSTGSLNATHHGWVVKKILGSGRSKTVILVFLGPILRNFNH